jgi:CRP-like cAMP-binding protein
MLNENLILELILNLNGKMLHNTPIFKNFDMQFLSELTFDLKRETYT